MTGNDNQSLTNGYIKQQGETSIKQNIVNQVNKKLKSVQEGTDRAKASYLTGELLSRTVKSKNKWKFFEKGGDKSQRSVVVMIKSIKNTKTKANY